MTTSESGPGRADRIAWTAAALSIAALVAIMALNGMIGLGEVAHDAFCPEHGRAV